MRILGLGIIHKGPDGDRDHGTISPVEVRQLQVGACGIKTLFGDLAIINEGLEGLQAIQELVHIVHHLLATNSTCKGSRGSEEFWQVIGACNLTLTDSKVQERSRNCMSSTGAHSKLLQII